MHTESSSTCGPSAHSPEVVSVVFLQPNSDTRNIYRVTFIDPEDGVTRKRYMFTRDELQAYTAFKDYWRKMYG
jgi:hypothetical protein